MKSIERDLFESYQASLTETTHFYRATNLRNSHISRSFCQGVLGSINGIRRGKRRNPLWIRVAIVPVSVSVYVSQHAAGNRGSLNIGMRIPFRCIKCDAIYENLHDFFFFTDIKNILHRIFYYSLWRNNFYIYRNFLLPVKSSKIFEKKN